MALSPEAAKILETAVSRIPEVAQIIAGIPAEHRPSVFDTAERSYLQTVQDLGCAEEAGQNWVSAVMFRLRAEVEERGLNALTAQRAAHEVRYRTGLLHKVSALLARGLRRARRTLGF
jgi:hypothetical protein